jgi:hypothetical protein
VNTVDVGVASTGLLLAVGERTEALQSQMPSSIKPSTIFKYRSRTFVSAGFTEFSSIVKYHFRQDGWDGCRSEMTVERSRSGGRGILHLK